MTRRPSFEWPTDEEILEKFGPRIDRAIRAFATDIEYAVDFALRAERVVKMRKVHAARVADGRSKPVRTDTEDAASAVGRRRRALQLPEPDEVSLPSTQAVGGRGALSPRSASSTRSSTVTHQSAKTHCPYGHAYDSENTRVEPQSQGRPGFRRVCRRCKAAQQNERRRKRQMERAR